MLGTTGGSKGVGSPIAAKRRRSPERPVPRGREARSGEREERSSRLARTHDGGTHLGLRRTHRPSRGAAGPEASAVSRSAFARGESPGACARGEKGSALPRGCMHDSGVRGSVREGDSALERGNETFARVGPVRAGALLRKHARSGSSPVHVPARGRPKAKACEGSSPSAAVRGATRSRWMPVHRRVCRSRQDALRLREARHRHPAGRKPAR